MELESDHGRWMREALREARKAFDAGEVPVGSVVVASDRVIGRGHNQVESLKDPTAHAEILALTQAMAQAEILTGRMINVTERNAAK